MDHDTFSACFMRIFNLKTELKVQTIKDTTKMTLYLINHGAASKFKRRYSC